MEFEKGTNGSIVIVISVFYGNFQGAAFGVNVLLERAKDELECHMHILVPKLYRYRYDPDAKVQSSMMSVWQTLTSSRKAVVCIRIINNIH